LTFELFIFSVGAATNKQHVVTKNIAKLDRETEELRHETVALDLSKVIMQARQAKGWSQKELATVSFFCIMFSMLAIDNIFLPMYVYRSHKFRLASVVLVLKEKIM